VCVLCTLLFVVPQPRRSKRRLGPSANPSFTPQEPVQLSFKSDFLQCVGESLSSQGFRHDKRVDWFTRKTNHRTEKIVPVFLDSNTTIRCWVGVRFDEVEAIFQQYTRLPDTSKQTADTIGLDLSLTRRPAIEIVVQDQKSTVELAATFLGTFLPLAMSFFAKYPDLQAVDSLLNSELGTYVPGCSHLQRRGKGIIVAYLLGRDDLEELASRHQQELMRFPLLKNDMDIFNLIAAHLLGAG